MPRVNYTLEEREFVYGILVHSRCVNKVSRRFPHRFHNVTFPRTQNIHAVVNKLRLTGLLLEKDRTASTCRVLTEEKLDEIGSRNEYFSQ
jgi:hypothetical protein